MNSSIVTAIVGLPCSLLPPAYAARQPLVGIDNKAFYLQGKKPDGMAVRRLATVFFNKAETTPHALYSVSKPLTLEAGVTQQNDQQSITLTKSGVVEVECAIHPDMKTRIVVQ